MHKNGHCAKGGWSCLELRMSFVLPVIAVAAQVNL